MKALTRLLLDMGELRAAIREGGAPRMSLTELYGVLLQISDCQNAMLAAVTEQNNEPKGR